MDEQEILPLIFVGIGATLLLVAAVVLFTVRLFVRDALRTQGTVVKLVERRGHKTGRSYSPMVKFTTPAGEFRFTETLSTNPAGYEVGDRVEVLYHWQDHSRAHRLGLPALLPARPVRTARHDFHVRRRAPVHRPPRGPTLVSGDDAAARGTTPTAARFDGRVENYAAHRPGYPAGLLDFLRGELGLAPASVVADIGSGTGILSEMFLRAGCRVFAVEPNGAMRAAAESHLKSYPNFESVAGTAEATTLDAGGVDFAAAAQAFHWFDVEGARREFRRILKPTGWAVLVWNLRRTDSDEFARDYEKLLRRFGTDYAEVAATYADPASLRRFFGGDYGAQRFDNFQLFDSEGFKGRLLSASYVPLAGHPDFEPMLAELRRVFDAHERGGAVRVEYDTEVYYGRLA